MNSVSVTSGNLVVEPHGMSKLWGFRRRIIVPLDHVVGATHDESVSDEPRGVRAPGLSIPGKHVGTFHRDGEKIYWNLSDRRNNLVITLRNEHFDRLILTVDQPRDVVDRINAAILG